MENLNILQMQKQELQEGLSSWQKVIEDIEGYILELKYLTIPMKIALIEATENFVKEQQESDRHLLEETKESIDFYA